MAVVMKKICDRCGKQSEENESEYTIKGFREITVELGRFNEKRLLICDECLEKAGLIEVDKENKENKIAIPLSKEGSIDKVFDLLAEIVAERIDK